MQKGFNKAQWLLGGPGGPRSINYLITDILYHDGKLYVATDKKNHMVQVIDAKTGASLGQINLPEFHPAAIALSLDGQDLYVVSAGDSKIYRTDANSLVGSMEEFADYSEYVDTGGQIRLKFNPFNKALVFANFHKNIIIGFNPVSGDYLGKHPNLMECGSFISHICGPLDFDFGKDGRMFISNWNWLELSSYEIPDYKQQQLLDNIGATDIKYIQKLKN